MYHFIEFTMDLVADLEQPGVARLERVRINKGTQFLVQVKPYVVETSNGPVEVADLFLEDGTTFNHLPFQYFSFVE